MSDESDRTVFKQPIPGGGSASGGSGPDRTSLRPSPGRRTGQTEVGRARPGGASSGQAAAGGRRGMESSAFEITQGLNPLVNAASLLIGVFEKTRHAARHPDIAGLHKRLVREIKDFEDKAKDEGIKPEIVLSARYLLCSALDEAVMHTPWGSESAWAQRTLLSIYHNETSGGEKCFLILDRLLQSPSENLDVLELFYICLSLGFEGKYRLHPRGRDQVENLRDELYRTLRRYHGEPERSLSTAWQGLGRGRKTLAHYVPLWVAASIFALIVFLGYAGFAYWMREVSNPVVEELNIIATPAVEEVENPSVFDQADK